jgi:DNA repair protein RadC
VLALSKQRIMKRNQKEILREIKITYSSGKKFDDLPSITGSKDAVQVFRTLWPPTLELREECYVLYLNRSNRAFGWLLVSIGGISGTVVDPRLIFSTALKCNAVSFVMAHNHPSGNLQPSENDKVNTAKMVEAGKFLELSLLDHIILTKEGHFSFADEGLIS